MSGFEKLADKLSLGADVKDVCGKLDTSIELISSISSVVGIPGAIVGILKTLGVFDNTDPTQAKLDAIVADFSKVFDFLSGEDKNIKMIDVATQKNRAKAQEFFIREEVDSPQPGQIGIALDESSQALLNLGDPAYYKRPFFPEEFYHDTWTGTLKPPLVDSNLLFDYRITLPAYLYAITVRLAVLSTFEPNYTKTHLPELKLINQNLQTYHDLIFNALTPIRLPSKDEIVPQHYGSSGPGSGWRQSQWDSNGQWEKSRLYGVVESISGLFDADSYPADEFPNFVTPPQETPPPFFPGLLFDDIYKSFTLRHQLLTLKRRKRLYRLIGLSAVWSTLKTVHSLLADSFANVTDFGNSWSAKELDKVVATTLLGRSSINDGTTNFISMTQLFSLLGKNRPEPVSFQTSIEQTMHESLWGN